MNNPIQQNRNSYVDSRPVSDYTDPATTRRDKCRKKEQNYPCEAHVQQGCSPYSGHGGLLPRVAGSPAGRRPDPSLLTAEFCLNEPPVRGWELNKWLKRLNKKSVQVIAVLDSCYSGSSWRNDQRVHSPADWEDGLDEGEAGEEAPEEANDETSAEESTEPSTESFFGNAALEKSWSINLDGFTLIAACKAEGDQS
ncbi:hypothetical protein BGZ61DRAFT_488326 [Ilyonectria robusta]|uniref:uncharacterized protein n=1 Tax=Ilyonectria robusta TaxID=1079257 RepID=UPI001E8EED88|nr:uncharacterized protein BGZ61DRAFT_488326 [Ilyonectria robusta]KAH8645892.1 hypothetical protein BGZ61DRAFT_488326 [Ilyonectria robusta]